MKLSVISIMILLGCGADAHESIDKMLSGATLIRLQGNGFSDLDEFDPLAAVFRRSTIVGLGEAYGRTTDMLT